MHTVPTVLGSGIRELIRIPLGAPKGVFTNTLVIRMVSLKVATELPPSRVIFCLSLEVHRLSGAIRSVSSLNKTFHNSAQLLHS